MSAENDPSGKPSDVLYVHSPSDSGDGFKVIRMREDAIEVGEIRSVAEGRPIHGEVVKLTQRAEHKQLFNVDVLVPGPKRLPEGEARSGPAQVATEAYRENWRAIFGDPRGGRGGREPGGSGEEPN